MCVLFASFIHLCFVIIDYDILFISCVRRLFFRLPFFHHRCLNEHKMDKKNTIFFHNFVFVVVIIWCTNKTYSKYWKKKIFVRIYLAFILNYPQNEKHHRNTVIQIHIKIVKKRILYFSSFRLLLQHIFNFIFYTQLSTEKFFQCENCRWFCCLDSFQLGFYIFWFMPLVCRCVVFICHSAPQIKTIENTKRWEKMK